jgi:2-alkyl-3-oxoalkanoate reductase
VTGATGLVGSHIVERLVADGWEVRALVRDPAAARWIADDLGAELARGDVLDAESFARAARGCDHVYHTAAAITPRGGWEAFRRPNIDGTANAIRAAGAAGARLLHLSSVAVYGERARYLAASEKSDERAALPPPESMSHYGRSKRESEAMVLAAHARGEVWGTAVRPSVIYGRRDRQFVPRVARVLSTGFFPLLGRGDSTLPIVHAAAVADAAVRAARHDAAGGRAFNAADDFPVTVREFVRLAAEGLGRRVRPVRVPLAAARAGMWAAQGVIALVAGRSKSAMSGATVDFLSRDNPFSSELARRELGWSPPVPPALGVPEAFRWWRERRGGRGG